MGKNKDKKIREKIDNLFKQSWQGKSVTLDLDGTDIKVDITSQTRRHFGIINSDETCRSYRARMKYFLSNNLISLISGANYEKTETERKSGQNKIHKYTKEWHYFAKNIQFNNKNYKVIFNIRESSQIQSLYVLHAVLFKESSLENQQILDIKKSERAISACSANSKSSSASTDSLSNKDELVNKDFEKFFSKSLGIYVIPYNSTAITVKTIEELNVQEPTLNYAEIGWNASNYAKILPVKYWTTEDYIDEKQDDWLKSHPNLNDITYADTLPGSNSDNLKHLCQTCKDDISTKIAQASLIIGGFSDENIDEIKLLVTADIDQDTFYNNFAGKVRNIIEKEIQPNIDIYIKQLPDGQVWAKDLSKYAKEFYEKQGQGRLGVNVKEYIENNKEIRKMDGTRIEINNEIRNQIKTYLTVTEPGEPKKKQITKEKNKGEEL